MKSNADLAAAKLPELLAIAVDRAFYKTSDEWSQACRIVNAAVQTALNMQVRADEGALRMKQFDRLEELLLMVAEEERRRPLQRLALDGQVLELPRLPDDPSAPDAAH